MEERIPCPDEMCVGTIGDDGRCRYCGKQHEGELPEGLDAGKAEADDVTPELNAQAEGAGSDDEATDDTASGDADAADADTDVDAGGGAAAAPPGGAPEPGEDGFVPFGDDRVPCSDELCTGTIGDDGKCRYCGKPA